MLSEDEKKSIERLNEILKEWQEIVKIEDKTEREIEMSLYMEDMPFEEINTVLNLITKLQKENEKLNLMIAKSTAQRVLTDIKHSKKSNEDLKMLAKGYDIEIQKLQKENEHWKNKFEEELEENRKNTCELLKQDLIIREKNKQIQLMSEYMEENMDEYQLEEIYAKQYNCNGMERNWTRGKEKEVEDIKQYFKKLAKEKGE